MPHNDEYRPASLDAYVGQQAIKDKLRPRIAQAWAECKPLPHILLTGESGGGKTTLAKLIAQEVSEPFTVIDLSKMTEAQFVSFIRRFEGGVLFIDELHRAKADKQEMLLTLMEEGQVTTSYGGTIPVDWLTVIAATTEKQKLLPTIVNRFPVRLELAPYTDDEMIETVRRMTDLPESDCITLGRAAAGNPRSARDLVQAYLALGYVTDEDKAGHALRLVGVEEDGLTEDHLRYLRALDQLEGQAGEIPLCNRLRCHSSQLLTLERLLIDRGLVTLTKGGRAITAEGDRRLRGERPTFRRRAS